MLRPAVLIALLGLLVAGPSRSQDVKTLDDLVREAERAEAEDRSKAIGRDIGVRDDLKQVEAPVMGSNSTSLLDTTSVSDLIGAALNLSELTVSNRSNGGSDGTGGSASITGYAIWSAFAGFDPLDPDRYCEPGEVWARRLSATVGRDNGEDGIESGVVAGMKFHLPIGTELCASPAFGDGGAVAQAMDQFGADRARLDREIVRRLGEELGLDSFEVRTGIDDPSAAQHAELNRRAGELARELIGGYMKSSAALDDAIAAEIKRLREGNRFALEFFTTQRDDGGSDEYMAALLWDHKGFLTANLDVTLNAAWEYQSNSGADNNGGMAALGLEYQMDDKRRRGRRPFKFSLAAQAKWMTHTEDTYTGQLKLVIPVLEGV